LGKILLDVTKNPEIMTGFAFAMSLVKEYGIPEDLDSFFEETVMRYDSLGDVTRRERPRD